MGIESTFQSQALKYLNSLPGCVAENVSGNAAQSGRPDINGCYKGRMFKLELKTPDHKNTSTKKQRLNLRRWRRAGCVVGVIYTMETLRLLFDLDWDLHPRYSTNTEIVEENGCLSWFDIPDWG